MPEHENAEKLRAFLGAFWMRARALTGCTRCRRGIISICTARAARHAIQLKCRIRKCTAQRGEAHPCARIISRIMRLNMRARCHTATNRVTTTADSRRRCRLGQCGYKLSFNIYTRSHAQTHRHTVPSIIINHSTFVRARARIRNRSQSQITL